VIDACDSVRAKAVLAAWSRQSGTPLVVVGAAGGKRAAERVEVGDLADVTHDPMLAALRQRLRKLHAAPRGGGRLDLCCVFSREPVAMPGENCEVDGSLNCHGYGSSVAVTATFGMVAAARALEFAALSAPGPTPSATL
jgi:tRNA A37 threonylcarbamoyladenosine dehydratase